MSLVVAILGEPSEKIVNGELKSVVPFVGADREGKFAQMGIGLLFPDEGKGMIWGLVMPHALIKSWRGMKLLEQVDRIEHGTLCGCWTIATSDVSDSDKRHLDELADQFGGMDGLEEARAKVLASVPSAEEIDSMISNLREKEVGVDSWDLTAEIEAGRIETSPAIELIIKKEDEERVAYARKEEQIKKPVPPEESLAQFFKDLRIGNFIIGGGFGGYGMDWGHIELKDLDQTAKRDSFSEYLTDGFTLEHTTQGPETFADDVAPGVTMYQTSSGEIENPWFLAADETRYTFLSAKFRDERFHIKAKVESADEPPQEGEFTIAQLREMIGPIEMPPAPTLIQRLAKGARSLFN
ncbi:hypothetical protein KC906_02290 [Candidatus Kaiserbacteria bacterium]|nr:hypothetical protein [Candidatus Kaiserbacteria bacterium]MCB9812197.1 hypothetical protein [Candidatus Nomurabacteria bacterium]